MSALRADELASTLLPTMFASAPTADDVEAFRAALLAFHPSGFRVLARACAEDVRAALPEISAPTLLIYGGRDERAPLYVANQLHEAIPGSTLVVLPEAGHVCSVEAPGEFNREIRSFVTKHAKQTA